MTEGILYGGWGFVWAAYGLSLLGLALYAGSVALRLRADERRHRELAAEGRPAAGEVR